MSEKPYQQPVWNRGKQHQEGFKSIVTFQIFLSVQDKTKDPNEIGN